MLKQLKRFRKRLRELLGRAARKTEAISEPQRYKILFEVIGRIKARRIMEIGTWNGNHAAAMIETAKKHWLPEEIEYYGFDLFEDMNEETFKTEVSKKPPPITQVKERLEKTGAKISLHKGNTLHTLPKAVKNLPQMDFIFIDGGHSVETVRNDWEHSQQLMHDRTVVIFDDYWNIDGSGCNKVVDSLCRDKFSVEILPPTDEFKKEWGILCVNFVKIMKRIRSDQEQ